LHFAPDTEESLEFVVALGNTDPAASRTGLDELTTLEQLATLLRHYGYTGRIDADAAELVEVLQTRDLLRSVWTLGRDDAAAEQQRPWP